MKKLLRVLLFALFFLAVPALNASAQEESVARDSDDTVNYVYEEPTMKNLSMLYWGISRNDINNNTHVDNYLMINECHIYSDYFTNEFEWKDVREAGRAFIDANKKIFPLRFEFIQPIKLGNYDVETNRFDILKDFQVVGIRRFEMYSPEFQKTICKQEWNIEGYPRGLVIELSRPFTLTYLTVDPAVAEAYIKEMLKVYESLGDAKKPEALFDTRDAYLFMKIKIFASKGDSRTQEGLELANVIGVLEGFDIYATRNKEMPLFSKSYRKRKKDGNAEVVQGNPNEDGAVSDPLPESEVEEVIDEIDLQ